MDRRVENYLALIANLDPGFEVVLLDETCDGLEQIADWTDGHSGIDALHVISHGAVGGLLLGGSVINLDNLGEHAQTLARIGTALTETADILLYGCDVAKGEVGQAFVTRLAALTSADVAASNDLTGSAQLGGNGILEVHVGDVTAATALNQNVRGFHLIRKSTSCEANPARFPAASWPLSRRTGSRCRVSRRARGTTRSRK